MHSPSPQLLRTSDPTPVIAPQSSVEVSTSSRESASCRVLVESIAKVQAKAASAHVEDLLGGRIVKYSDGSTRRRDRRRGSCRTDSRAPGSKDELQTLLVDTIRNVTVLVSLL